MPIFSSFVPLYSFENYRVEGADSFKLQGHVLVPGDVLKIVWIFPRSQMELLKSLDNGRVVQMEPVQDFSVLCNTIISQNNASDVESGF